MYIWHKEFEWKCVWRGTSGAWALVNLHCTTISAANLRFAKSLNIKQGTQSVCRMICFASFEGFLTATSGQSNKKGLESCRFELDRVAKLYKAWAMWDVSGFLARPSAEYTDLLVHAMQSHILIPVWSKEVESYVKRPLTCFRRTGVEVWKFDNILCSLDQKSAEAAWSLSVHCR